MKKPPPRKGAGKQAKPKAVPPRAHSRRLTDNPREAAFLVLKETREGQMPEEALESHGRLLEPRDLGLATALVYEVLRHRSFLEKLARSRLTRGRASDDLIAILVLGLAQLLFFSRLGDHAVVMETVNLALKVIPGRQGVVNAVLRGLIRHRDEGLPWPPEIGHKDPIQDLAVRHSYQPWFVEKALALWGREETEDFLAAGNRPTPPTIRVNPLKTDRDALARALPFPVEATALSPWGLKADGFYGEPSQWPGFEEGLFSLQDEASQLIGLLAGPLEDQRVLDTCAGLGGKSLLLAALNPTAQITALDKDHQRLTLLEREADRLGCPNVTASPGDLLAAPPSGGPYDLVLVDAPCSGLGVIRRRPDLKWNKRPEDLARLAELQLDLLKAAAPLVKPGGRLIYGICSFSRQEGPDNAQKFLAAHPDFTAAPPPQWPEGLRHFLSPDSHLTLLPHRHDTDGFFWAIFNRNS